MPRANASSPFFFGRRAAVNGSSKRRSGKESSTMFESIRKHQRILLGFLLLFIFPAFAFFGISGYDRMFSDEGVVARVDGDRITRQEYELAQRRQVENMRQVLGDKFDPRIF